MKSRLLALSLASLLLIGLAGCKKLRITGDSIEDTPAVRLDLGQRTASVGEAINVSFGRALTPPAGQQYWLTLVPAGAADSEWGEWHYVPSGVSTDKLTPKTAGAFEVRLHDVHPAHDHSVIGRAKITVGDAPSETPTGPVAFKLARTELKVGQPVDITYSQALVAPAGQQYWITLAPAGSPDAEWGVWHYVAASATHDSIPTANAGTFEVRIHDLHPRKSHGVLHRETISVR